MTKVLFAAAESALLYKTGGLGDVAYGLPQALAQIGVTVRVVVPYYAQLMPAKYRSQIHDVQHFNIQIGPKTAYCGIKSLKLGAVDYYLIDNLDYFGRPQLYGYWDDGERFAFFQLAICEMMERLGFIPDVLHLNDWHTAFIPVLLAEKYYWIQAYQEIKTLLTIHNLQFQGIYDAVILDSLFRIGLETFNEQGIAFYDQVNFMKAGLNFADGINAVSPTYAREIQTPAFGERLDGVLRANQAKLTGILNGIDTQRYDPHTDSALKAHFTADNLAPRQQNKAALQRTVGLPVKDVPLLAVVSRLTRQKGIQLLLDALDPILKTTGVQLVVLGTGDPDLEQAFKIYQMAYPHQVAVKITFDEQLAQQIYAGSDLFLMPSVFEPCGLSQMMAMHYGSLPVVHATGGLRDTVSPYNRYTDHGTGFAFEDFRPVAFQRVLRQAIQLYETQPRAWQRMQRRAMRQAFGWQSAAKKYRERYTTLMS